MDLLYIGQTGFKDMDLCFNKIMSPRDILVKNKTIVNVEDDLLIQRLMATGRYKEVETSTVKEKDEDDKIDEVIYEDDVIEEIEEEFDDEED